MSSDFYVGMKVQYYSASFNEWIDCSVAHVHPNGCLRLEHVDGSGALKESADPSNVRPHPDEKARPPAGGVAGRKAPSIAAPAGKAAAPTPKRQNSRGPPVAPGAGAGSRPSSPPKGGGAVGRQPSVPRVGEGTPRAAAPKASVPGPPSARGQPGGGAQRSLEGTLNPKSLYVGDRVNLKSSGRAGEVMYVGPATFADGAVVVGIRLDEKRSTSDCDGKYKGERYFRCTAGYGIYQTQEEIELVPAELADEDVRQLEISPAPDLETFDLERELESVVGLKEVKDAIRHTRNFIEVQKRRCSVVGDNNCRALHFAFLHSGPGAGASTAARLLAGILLKLGVVAKGHLVEVAQKDLTAGSSSGDVGDKWKKIVKAADGGVLLVHDVDTLKDIKRAGEEALAAVGKEFESITGAIEWPQRLCLVVAGKRGELSKCLTDYPSLGNGVFAKLDFADLTAKDIAQILRKIVKGQQFQLSEDLTDDKLEALVRRCMAAGAGGGPKNARLAKTMLEEAISRQTDRVYVRGTLSYDGLTTLVEDDFVDRSREENEAAQAALRKLDSIVGLKPVKEFVHSLYAQLQLEQQKREMGIDARGASSTLHMVFAGNPGTGKTTVGRVVADLLKALGLLRTGHLIEADRAALVAGYSGQTALKTKAVVDTALGGVLFIDEAYALVGDDGKDSFGREALDTIVKLVEDYRSDLVVILAGYTKEMKKLFDANSGLQSRFPTVLEFDDYSVEELLEIAEHMLLQDTMMLSMTASQKLRQVLEATVAQSAEGNRASGNGRAVRNLLERAKRNQAVRLQQLPPARRSHDELCTLHPEDFDA